MVSKMEKDGKMEQEQETMLYLMILELRKDWKGKTYILNLGNLISLQKDVVRILFLSEPDLADVRPNSSKTLLAILFLLQALLTCWTERWARSWRTLPPTTSTPSTSGWTLRSGSKITQRLQGTTVLHGFYTKTNRKKLPSHETIHDNKYHKTEMAIQSSITPKKPEYAKI